MHLIPSKGKTREKHDTPRLSWHFQSLPRLQISLCYIGDCDKSRRLSVRGKVALNSPLSQVILVKIWHLPYSFFCRFALLSPSNTGHHWLHFFCLALVSVKFIQTPTSLEKSGSRKGSRQTPMSSKVLQRLRTEGNDGSTFPFLKKYGIIWSLDSFGLRYPFDTLMRWSSSTRWQSQV